mmetsp:Transcript_21933/g.39766  ORF Transcript_21933/g.39766 Transcript_21933/m.39766 type:complete len:211 (+) Transcript_21933:840-1472(+)
MSSTAARISIRVARESAVPISALTAVGEQKLPINEDESIAVAARRILERLSTSNPARPLLSGTPIADALPCFVSSTDSSLMLIAGMLCLWEYSEDLKCKPSRIGELHLTIDGSKASCGARARRMRASEVTAWPAFALSGQFERLPPKAMGCEVKAVSTAVGSFQPFATGFTPSLEICVRNPWLLEIKQAQRKFTCFIVVDSVWQASLKPC